MVVNQHFILFKVYNTINNIMSNFRIKKNKNNKKSKKNDIRGSTTLEKKHKQKVKKINTKKKSLSKIKNDLLKIEQELELLEEKRSSFTANDLEHRADLLNQKDELNDKLEEINNNNEELNYYDKAGDLISNYYEIRDKKVNEITESKNILEYLNPNKNEVYIAIHLYKWQLVHPHQVVGVFRVHQVLLRVLPRVLQVLCNHLKKEEYKNVFACNHRVFRIDL